jgi:hypothetical protein
LNRLQVVKVSPRGMPKRMEILHCDARNVQRHQDPRGLLEAHQRRSSPLTPAELANVIREMPRDSDVVEMLKKFSGIDPLSSR